MITVADPKDDEINDDAKVQEAERTKGRANKIIKGLTLTETNIKTSEPTKKKRRVVMEDSDDEATSKPNISPKATTSFSSKAPRQSAPPPNFLPNTSSGLVEVASSNAEESNSDSAEEDLELDAKAEVKSAEELFRLFFEVANAI